MKLMQLAATILISLTTATVASAQALVKCKDTMLVTSVKSTPASDGYDYNFTLRNFSKQNLVMYVFVQNFPAGFAVDKKQQNNVRVSANGGTTTLKLGHFNSANPGHIEYLYDSSKSSSPSIGLMNCQVAP